MRRVFHAGDVEILVDVSIISARRFRWQYRVPMLGLEGGSDLHSHYVEQAFETAERAAQHAIEIRLEE